MIRKTTRIFDPGFLRVLLYNQATSSKMINTGIIHCCTGCCHTGIPVIILPPPCLPDSYFDPL